MSIQEIQNFNAANHDWFVSDCGLEMATLRCRDTGEVATIHLDDLATLEV